MYRQYQTNSQAWNEVANSFNEEKRRTAICKAMFGQENLIGLSEEQRNAFWEAI